MAFRRFTDILFNSFLKYVFIVLRLAHFPILKIIIILNDAQIPTKSIAITIPIKCRIYRFYSMHTPLSVSRNINIDCK